MYLSLSVIVIASILGIYFLYQTFFLIGLVRIPTLKNPETWPGASIIIAARNEYQNLQSLVPSLLDQDYRDFEIVIVNDRSDDESYDYMMQLKSNQKIKVVFVDHLPEHVNSKKYALTLGIKAAKNDLLVFTDADCIPSSRKWLEGIVSGYNDETKMVIGFSPYLKEKGLLNSLIRFETHLTGILYLSFASNKIPYMGVGRNLSYRKQFFLERKGFNGFQEITGGDDDLFVNKNAVSHNTRIALSPESTTYSIPKKTFRKFVDQKIRHMSVGKRYHGRDKFLLGLFSIAHILCWISMIFAVILKIYPLIFGLLFLMSNILFILNFWILNRKSGSVYSLWIVPFVDILYGFFYIFVGMRTLFTKKVEWTT